MRVVEGPRGKADVGSFSDGTEIEPWPRAHPSGDAPVRSYPDPPRVALSRLGYALEGRYVVPLAGQELTETVRRAVSSTGRLEVVDLDDEGAHLANRAVAGVGMESIILRFEPVSDGRTRIDGVDRSPFAIINTRPGHLFELFQDIADQLGQDKHEG